jgi:hypothetical protein
MLTRRKPKIVEEFPVVICDIETITKTRVIVAPNYGGVGDNDCLEQSRLEYKKEGDLSVPIYLSVSGKSVGLTIDNAEEMIVALQSMVNYIKN